ncbi:serine hydrolase domain-containing protein [Actinomadura kijaniata]|uniref:serine hydrolase domain-containing protein n=1 Tax=Actinomadura kijaniata TaxID=46161 RepID=UPI003F1DD7CD
MTEHALNRRDFGKIAGMAGAGAVLSACSTEQRAASAGAAAAAPAWKATGRALAGLGGFDATMRKFMTERGVSAGQLAVVRKGRLLLARGYSYSADPRFAVQPTSPFRIASISKPITATAVLRLVQDGKLKLTDRVARLLGLSTAADPRLGNVTVLHLLQHLGGWDKSLTPDVMWRDLEIAKALNVPLPIKHAHIMRYASTLRLNHAPGTRFAYCNYGYMLLGRIIERVTGQSYAAYVQRAVLAPRGITRMKLGRSLTRAPGEVPYSSIHTGPTVFDGSGRQVPYPYGGFNLENHDAQGGWLSTAVDLVRFAGIYDGGTSVLNATSISRAFAKPATGVNADGFYFGAGWMVRPVKGGRNTWHDGSMAGTSTLLVRRFDGLTWAVLFNRRQEGKAPSFAAIDGMLHQAANAVKTWPTGHLYPTYF